jgi:hypothetical protein
MQLNSYITTVKLLNQSMRMRMQMQLRFSAMDTAVRKMATPLKKKKKANCFLWFNKSKCVKRVQRRNFEWIHLLCHPSMHFANSSVKQAVCVNGKFPSMKLEYEPDGCRIRNNANREHL